VSVSGHQRRAHEPRRAGAEAAVRPARLTGPRRSTVKFHP
jgi:hypothetical protein